MDPQADELRPQPQAEVTAAEGEGSSSTERPTSSWEGYSPELLTILLEG
jgi:hypothetical protein